MTEVNIGYAKNDFLWNADAGSGANADALTNQTNSEDLLAMQRTQNTANERYSNSKKIYQRAIIDNVNLGVGIVACCAFIFFNYNSAPVPKT